MPPVQNLTCVVLQTNAGSATAILRWENGSDEYTRILIIRNSDLIESLPGDAERFADPNLEPGVYEYGVIAVIGNRRSPSVDAPDRHRAGEQRCTTGQVTCVPFAQDMGMRHFTFCCSRQSRAQGPHSSLLCERHHHDGPIIGTGREAERSIRSAR